MPPSPVVVEKIVVHGPDALDEYTEAKHVHVDLTQKREARVYDLLFVADFAGLFHCVNAKTGKSIWTHDLLSASWASPLIVENHVYISDEDGDRRFGYAWTKAKDEIDLITGATPTFNRDEFLAGQQAFFHHVCQLGQFLNW